MKRRRSVGWAPQAAVALAIVALVAAGLWAATPSRTAAQLSGLQSFETGELTVRTKAGEAHKFTVEIARTPQQQTQGLMFRRRLAPDAGMLFLYGGSRRARMWMKNTYIPLDMIFIGNGGRIVDMAQRTVPLSLETVASNHPVRAVLEVNAGTVARLGLAVGDRVAYPAFTGAN